MNGERLLLVLGGILFCCAITVLLGFADRVNSIGEAIYTMDYKNSNIVQVSSNDEAIPNVKFEQIVCELMNDELTYDLSVNGYEIKIEEYNLMLLKEYLPVNYYTYEKKILHNETGNVLCVTYEMVK